MRPASGLRWDSDSSPSRRRGRTQKHKLLLNTPTLFPRLPASARPPCVAAPLKQPRCCHAARCSAVGPRSASHLRALVPIAMSDSSRRFLPARYLLPYEPRRSLAFRTAEVLAVTLVPTLAIWVLFARARLSRRWALRAAAPARGATSAAAAAPASPPLAQQLPVIPFSSLDRAAGSVPSEAASLPRKADVALR